MKKFVSASFGICIVSQILFLQRKKGYSCNEMEYLTSSNLVIVNYLNEIKQKFMPLTKICFSSLTLCFYS